MRRICSCFLVFVLILNFTLPVYAADDSHTETETLPGVESETTAPERPSIASGKTPAEKAEEWRFQIKNSWEITKGQVVANVLTNMGIVLSKDSFDAFLDFYCSQSSLTEDDMFEWVDESSGDVVVPSEVVQDIYNEVNIFLQQEEGFYIEPGLTHNLTWILNHLKYYTCIASLSDYSEITAFMGKNNFFSFSPFSWQGVRNQFFMYGSSASYVVRLSDNRFYFYDDDLNLVEPEVIGRYDIFDYTKIRSLNFTLHDIQGSFSPEISLNSYSGPYWLNSYYGFKTDTKVFSSLDSLNDYLYGQQSIFIMSGIEQRIADLNVSINSLAVDYSKFNQESVDKIIQAIQDKELETGSSLAESILQGIVDAIMMLQLEELETTIAAGNLTNDLANALIYEKLDEIYKLLKKWYSGDEVADELSKPLDFKDITDFFAADPDLTDAPTNIFEQLLQKTDSLINLGVNELIVPDAALLDEVKENLYETIPIFGLCRDFVSYVQVQMSYEETPRFRFSLFKQQLASFSGDWNGDGLDDDPGDANIPRSTLSSALGDKAIEFDFSWYELYRERIKELIAGFLWVCWLWRAFLRLPVYLGDPDEAKYGL